MSTQSKLYMLKKSIERMFPTGRQSINEMKYFPQIMPKEKLITGGVREEKDLSLLQSQDAVLFLPLEI